MKLPSYQFSISNFQFQINKLKHWKFSAGFTLIELIIVIAILGIIAAAMIWLIDPVAQIAKGHDATHQSDIRQIQGALEFYRSQYGGYPSSGSSGNFPTSCNASWISDSTGTLNGTTNTTTTLMQNVPCDSTQSPPAVYRYTACGTSFTNSSGTTVNPQYVITGCMEYSGTKPQGALTSIPSNITCSGAPTTCSSANYTLFYFVNP